MASCGVAHCNPLFSPTFAFVQPVDLRDITLAQLALICVGPCIFCCVIAPFVTQDLAMAACLLVHILGHFLFMKVSQKSRTIVALFGILFTRPLTPMLFLNVLHDITKTHMLRFILTSSIISMSHRATESEGLLVHDAPPLKPFDFTPSFGFDVRPLPSHAQKSTVLSNPTCLHPEQTVCNRQLTFHVQVVHLQICVERRMLFFPQARRSFLCFSLRRCDTRGFTPQVLAGCTSSFFLFRPPSQGTFFDLLPSFRWYLSFPLLLPDKPAAHRS